MAFTYIKSDWNSLSAIGGEKANKILGDYWQLQLSNCNKSFNLLLRQNNEDFYNFNHALAIIKYWLLKDVTGKLKDIIQLLVTRISFNIESSFVLALSANYLGSFILLRDVVESCFLLDYFLYYPEKILEWADCNEEERERKFKANVLYQALTSEENLQSRSRWEIYNKIYSKWFTHVSPNFSFYINTEEKTRRTGPEIVREYLIFNVWELNIWTSHACLLYLSNLRPSSDVKFISVLDGLMSQMKEYLYEKDNPPF